MNKKKKLFWSTVIIYVVLGLLVATQGGFTRETIRKIKTQYVTDQIIDLKRAYKNSTNEIAICYTAHRSIDFRGLGSDDEIENWLFISVEEWKSGDRWPSYKVNTESSYFQSCSNTPSRINSNLQLKIQVVNNKKFNGFFNIKYPEFDENVEKIYATNQDQYLKVGYVNNLSDDVIAFKIFAPEVINEGDKLQIFFIPFALIADVVIWPLNINNFFNSIL